MVKSHSELGFQFSKVLIQVSNYFFVFMLIIIIRDHDFLIVFNKQNQMPSAHTIDVGIYFMPLFRFCKWKRPGAIKTLVYGKHTGMELKTLVGSYGFEDGK